MPQLLHNLVDADTCQLVTDVLASAPEVGDSLVPDNALCWYGNPTIEALMLRLRPIVASECGVRVAATYGYGRRYSAGASMAAHRDRPSCELSITLCVGSSPDLRWPLYVDGTPYVTKPGDGLLYRGRVDSHWREPLIGDGVWQSQVFLHYVDKDGPCAGFERDCRPRYGLAASERDPLLSFAASAILARRSATGA